LPREETTPPVMKTNRVMGDLSTKPRGSREPVRTASLI
jgi:hypothetical protein